MTKRRVGRPSKFKPEYIAQAQKLCRLGPTDAEVADFFGVSRDTLHKWKIAHPEFADTLKLGKEEFDNRVEKALYHKAVGYSMPATKILVLKEMTIVTERKTGKEISRTYREVVHHEPYVQNFAPDTTSCIFWLKNRRPEDWRDVKAVEHDIGKRLSGLGESQIKSRLTELLRKAGATRVVDGESTPVATEEARVLLSRDGTTAP